MATVDLRCDGTLHGRLTDDRWLEVKCRRRSCGYRKGLVVLHTIDITSGKTTKTDIFAEPQQQKGQGHGSEPPTAVRSA